MIVQPVTQQPNSAPRTAPGPAAPAAAPGIPTPEDKGPNTHHDLPAVNDANEAASLTQETLRMITGNSNPDDGLHDFSHLTPERLQELLG